MTPNEVVLTAPDHVLNPKAPEGLSFTGYISLSPNTNGEPLMAHELATTNGKTAMLLLKGVAVSLAGTLEPRLASAVR